LYGTVKVWELLFALVPGLGVPVGLVTAEVATGLVVVQVKSWVQLFPPSVIVQVGLSGSRVPDMTEVSVKLAEIVWLVVMFEKVYDPTAPTGELSTKTFEME